MATPTLLRKPKRYIKKTREKFSVKGLLLYFLPLAAVPAAIIALINGNITEVLVNSGSYIAYVYAAWLLRQGIAAESQYQRKRITRPPKRPLKFYSAVIVAVTTGLLALLGTTNSLLISIVFGFTAFLAMYLAYGFDPRTDKSVSNTKNHGYSTEEISKTIDEAETLIAEIEQANDLINNREFNTRIDRICDIARNILKTIEKNPGDIRRARKFLKVYLEGAQKVTNGYANTHRDAGINDLEDNFRNVLDKIETVFIEQKDKLMEDNLFDLDVQIEVLTTQLKQEGII